MQTWGFSPASQDRKVRQAAVSPVEAGGRPARVQERCLALSLSAAQQEQHPDGRSLAWVESGVEREGAGGRAICCCCCCCCFKSRLKRKLPGCGWECRHAQVSPLADFSRHPGFRDTSAPLRDTSAPLQGSSAPLCQPHHSLSWSRCLRWHQGSLVQ